MKRVIRYLMEATEKVIKVTNNRIERIAEANIEFINNYIINYCYIILKMPL